MAGAVRPVLRAWQLVLLALLGGMLAVTFGALWLWRHAATTSSEARTPAGDLARAERAVAAAASASGGVQMQVAGQPDSARAVPRALTSSQRLAALYARGGDPRALAREAALSDDPVLWVRSLDLLLLCISGKFSPPLTPETTAAWRSGKQCMTEEQIADIVASQEKARQTPPVRWALAPNLAGVLTTMMARAVNAHGSDVERAIERAMEAPLSNADRAAREQILEGTRAHCAGEGGPDPFVAFREARARGVAQGATGALVRNRNAGWTSKSFEELSDADYALVERIVRERQPDGLAALLSQAGVSLHLPLLAEGAELGDRAVVAQLRGPVVVAALAGCALGVNDCSANSPVFKENCAEYGGCHLPDVAAQARYILARDGLDPQWFDREVARVVKAIYEGDLAAIGMRLASAKPKPKP